MSENNLKTHYSAKELLAFSLSLLPNSVQGIIYQAKKQGWTTQKRVGKGGGVEYALNDLPQTIQQQIKLKLALAEPTPQPDTAPKASLATLLNNASEKARQQATHKAEAVRQVQRRMDVGIGLMQAIEQVSQEFNVASGSLKNWFYKVQGYHIHEWAMVLLKQTGKKAKAHQKAFIEQEAWEVFLTDYLRPEQPSFAACYRRTAELANEMGWEIASKQTFQRKLANEVPYETVVYQRQGANAVAKLVPALRRSVKDLFVMEWLNGDGYQHNVFVRFPSGEINRPKTWFWQDVKSRRIVGYRTAISENTDSIRHALMDVIFHYGIPKTVTIDNTRAAANKTMTGGIENRYRFKHSELDPKGILPLLGIDVHFTQVLYGEGHGQAKPIERAFGRGGIGELVDKQISLSGFYTGRNIHEKPDNYNGGKDGVDWQIFLEALERGVQAYNSQTGRRTEMCQGKLSFDEVWQQHYDPSRIVQANPEQLRLLFLQSETVRIKKNGEFTLKAAGKLMGLENVYWAESLIGNSYKHIVARFDPDNLHGNVYLYDLDGTFLAEAICRQAVSFKDTTAAREQGRLTQRVVKNAKRQAKDLELLSDLQMAELQRQVDVPQPIEEKVRENLMDKAIRTHVVQEHNALRVVETEEYVEEVSEFEQAFQRGVAKLKQSQG